MLPVSLDLVAPDDAPALIYRPVPNLSFDGRLVLLYDRAPQHSLLEFPVLRPGWAVHLLGGKTLLMNQDQLEKLLAADNALRERCGLEAL